MGFDVREWLDTQLRRSPYELSEARLHELAGDDNGYVRESATRALAGSQSPEALRVLLERLNDWVPQVRQAAREAVEAYLQPERLPALLANLDALLALTGKGRADHGEVLERAGALLQLREARIQVMRHAMVRHGAPARFLFEQLAKGSEEAVRARVFGRFLQHGDVTVRLQVVRVCGGYSAQWSTDLLLQALDDAHFAVRREALHLVFPRQTTPAARHTVLARCLLDRCTPVREWAVWLAHKSGFDCSAFVRTQVEMARLSGQTPAELLGLIHALCDHSQLLFVQAALRHAQVKVRRMALLAFVRLAPQSSDEAVARALADPAPKLLQLARRFIGEGTVALSTRQFQQAFSDAIEHCGMVRAVLLAEMMMYWERLDSLLVCARLCAPAEREFVNQAFQRWARIGGMPSQQPDPARRLLLQARLRELRRAGALPDTPEIRFTFEVWGILPGNGK